METLKVLMLNGSPRSNGNTAVALREMETVFRENGVEVETVVIGNRAIRGCVACGGCAKIGKCVFDDAVNELAPKFEAADGLVVASPVYYASANATLVACLDRLFYSTPFDKTMKVGASVVCAHSGVEAPIDHSPFPGCRWPPVSIGTVSTAVPPVRRRPTGRAARPCGRWQGT